MSIEIGEVIRWATPLIAGIIGYFVRTLHSRIKDLENKIDENEEKLIETFRAGLKEEREFRTDVMQKHDRHIEEIFGKLKGICVDGAGMKKDLERCVKTCDRIRFKS